MKKRYKLVPPDGRYGYAIVAAASINLMIATMFMVSFGMIFHDFFIKLRMGSTEVSVLTGIKALFLAVSGFLTGPLEKMMSKRQLALMGCVFFNVGGFGIVFVNTKVPFIICQGLLQSIGSGFLMNISYSIVTDYFVKRRMLFMAFIHTMSCAASMVAPILVTWSMKEYGYQSTLIIMTAIGVHSFAACALIQPVAWHMRKVRIPDDAPASETKLLLKMEDIVYTSTNMLTPTFDIKESGDENAENRFTLQAEPTTPQGCSVVNSWFRRYLDWPLFKRYVLTGRGVGLPTAMFADITYMYFLPRAMYAGGWDRDQVKWAFALLGVGDIACRIAITLLSELLKRIRSHWLYLFGLLLAIGTRLALLWVSDYTCILAVIGVMGVSRSLIIVLTPLVIGDYSGPDKFPSVIGISFMMFGLISIVLGPVIGAIADAAQSHTLMFEILTGIMAAVAISWVIEITWWDNRKSRKQQAVQK